MTVDDKEYMDLLALKNLVGAVVKTYREQRQFIGTPGVDSLMTALERSTRPPVDTLNADDGRQR